MEGGPQFVPNTLGDARFSKEGFAKLDSYEQKEKPKGLKCWRLTIMWVIWNERNRKVFDGMQHDFIKLHSSVLALVAFWCTFEVPICIQDWISFVENTCCGSSSFGIWVVHRSPHLLIKLFIKSFCHPLYFYIN